MESEVNGKKKTVRKAINNPNIQEHPVNPKRIKQTIGKVLKSFFTWQFIL
jgi:hypothetical protein